MNILESKTHSKCSPSEELVALLYDELDPAVRLTLEDHLAACDACAGEFAELSFARLDVYEWHRDEFVEMATPRIVIPYTEAVTRMSWLDAFRGLFASPGQWATAGAGIALVLAVIAGVWLFGSKPVDVAEVGPEPNVVQEPNNTREIQRPAAAPTPAPVENRPVSHQPSDQPQRVSSTSAKKPVAQPAKATSTPANRPPGNRQPLDAKRQPTPPRLNDFEDEDDTTLRLGDLLAEVDTRD